jgi:sulfur carrier protein ThiS
LRLFVRVTVTFRPRRQPPRAVDLPPGATVEALLGLLGTPPDTVLVVRGAAPVADDEALRDGDEVTVLSAFSGG